MDAVCTGGFACGRGLFRGLTIEAAQQPASGRTGPAYVALAALVTSSASREAAGVGVGQGSKSGNRGLRKFVRTCWWWWGPLRSLRAPVATSPRSAGSLLAGRLVTREPAPPRERRFRLGGRLSAWARSAPQERQEQLQRCCGWACCPRRCEPCSSTIWRAAWLLKRGVVLQRQRKDQ